MSGPDGTRREREGSKARKALKDQDKNGRKNGLVVFKGFPHHFQHLIKRANTYIILIVC